jgi:hypothetical protein
MNDIFRRASEPPRRRANSDIADADRAGYEDCPSHELRMKEPMSRFLRAIDSDAPPAVVLIRLAVGIVFTSEGIQKFLYPAALGAGRFTTDLKGE